MWNFIYLYLMLSGNIHADINQPHDGVQWRRPTSLLGLQL